MVSVLEGSARALIRIAIPGLLKRGFSGRRILSYVRSEGWPIRTQLFYRDLREFQDSLKFGRRIIDFPDNKLPTRRSLQESELPTEHKYRIIGTAQTKDKATGYVKYTEKSFHTEILSTKEELSQEFIESKLWETTDPRYVVEGFQVRLIMHNEGWPY